MAKKYLPKGRREQKPQYRLPLSDLFHFLSQAAQASNAVSTYCDRIEHIQRADRQDVVSAAVILRHLAIDLADCLGLNIFELYAERLTGIENTSGLDTFPSLRPAVAVARGTTWALLQEVQVSHDRQFHPDVFGMSRTDQLRHYAFHVAKFPWALARLGPPHNAPWHQFIATRLPDMLLFGLKLSTVMNEQLLGLLPKSNPTQPGHRRTR